MHNAEDLSIEAVIVGPRGSGKTLLLTHFGIEFMERAWILGQLRKVRHNNNLFPRKKANIWANYSIKGLFRPPGYSKAILLSSLPLDIERLITWQPEFRDGYIIYDEIDQDADRQDWMAQLPKLLVKGIKLMRHRNLSLYASLQFIDELNIRLYKQADIVIQTRDLAFTPFGRDMNLATGEIASTSWIDRSGIMTGEAFDDSHQVYQLRFFGKRYWGNYATRHEFDVMRPKYKVKSEVREITTVAQAEEEEKGRQAIYTAIAYFVYDKPGVKIKSTDFMDKYRALGGTWANVMVGKFLKGFGINSTLYQGVARYDFSEIELDKVLA